MKVTIIGRKMDVKPSLKQHIEDKLSKLEKYFRDDADVYVTLSHEKKGERLELTVSSVGTLFRAEEQDATFQNALDTALDTIIRQIRKNKTRLAKRLKDGAIKNIEAEFDADDEEIVTVRKKSFVLNPMSVEEAILQMNLLGHTFFMFINEETSSDAVVYKRKQGGYGLIEPEK